MNCAYTTRHDAFTPTWELQLRGGELVIVAERAEVRRITLAEVTELRLEFAPTRVEPNRYRCRLVMRRGAPLTFFNRSYEGLAQFRETSTDYVAFMTALLRHLSRHAPGCRFVAGASAGTYALSVVGFGIAVVAVLGVAVFAILVGLWWLVIVKALVIAFYLPNAWRWLQRNRERWFEPDAPPAAVLPIEA